MLEDILKKDRLVIDLSWVEYVDFEFIQYAFKDIVINSINKIQIGWQDNCNFQYYLDKVISNLIYWQRL